MSAASLSILGYSLHNIVGALSSYFFGHISDRTRKLPLLAFGYALAAATFAGFWLAGNSTRFLLLLFMLAGVYLGIEEVVEKAAAAELLPAETRGLGFGALASANGLGDLISSGLAGWLWTYVSPLAAFQYSFGLSVVGACTMLAVSKAARNT
jgi:MFS family permease